MPDWNIEQVKAPPNVFPNGLWYIWRKFQDGFLYLHRDGSEHNSVMNEAREFPGYFDTQEEAVACVARKKGTVQDA